MSTMNELDYRISLRAWICDRLERHPKALRIPSNYIDIFIVREFLDEKECAALIELIDPTQRITDVAIAARISGAEYRAWRTVAQHAASPNSMSVGMNGGRDRGPVVTVQRRAALRLDRTRLVEDLLVQLRRQFPSGN